MIQGMVVMVEAKTRRKLKVLQIDRRGELCWENLWTFARIMVSRKNLPQLIFYNKMGLSNRRTR